MTMTSSTQHALISVYDKTSLSDLASFLSSKGVAIIATGNTYQQLVDDNIAVTELCDYTNFPEIMDGRVKSLHPKIYGGILARPQQDQHTLNQHDITPFNYVVCNLYPFIETINQSDCSEAKAIEQIDIGGPSMIRAAAKNFHNVTVITDPNDYTGFIDELSSKGSISLDTRRLLACKAFKMIAEYNAAIAHYFETQAQMHSLVIPSPNYYQTSSSSLRYGENPQQQACAYQLTSPKIPGVLHAKQQQGKALSYNNLIDADAALNVLRNLSTDAPSCAIIKHATPCGVATHADITQAYQLAYQCDSESAFGGIIAINTPLTAELIKIITEQQFVEVILAPSVDQAALTIAACKTNLRILEIGDHFQQIPETQYRSISGGMLVQHTDSRPLSLKDLDWVTQAIPTMNQQQDALFAWEVVKCVKSNAIVYCKDGRTLGIGSGQTSRIFSAKIAALRAQQAGLNLNGATMASDAFFPFADNIDCAHQHGVRCIIQPGGSKRDNEVIARANHYQIAMAFTHRRHFYH